MKVELLDLATLPVVKAMEVEMARAAAWALGALPRRAEVDLPPLGPLLLNYAGLGRVEMPPAERVVFALVRAQRVGRLTIGMDLGHRLLSRVLGSSEAVPVRRLGPGERALLGGVLSVLVNKLGSELAVSLAPPARVPRSIPIAIDVTASGIAGQVVLEVPPKWIPHVARAERWRVHAARLRVVARLEIARTVLPARDLAEVAPGDAVVFERAAPPELARSWPPGLLTLGNYAAAAEFADRAVTLAGPFQPRSTASLRACPGKETEMASAISVEAAVALAAAPVEVVAELGRVTLRGDEVLALGPGTVLKLEGAAGRAPVLLCVGNEVWAEGELVNVDGELGVRVTAVRRPPEGTPSGTVAPK